MKDKEIHIQENALKQALKTPAECQQKNAELQQVNAGLQQTVAELQQRLDWFNRYVFEKKSEKQVGQPSDDAFLPGFEFETPAAEVNEATETVHEHTRKKREKSGNAETALRQHEKTCG